MGTQTTEDLSAVFRREGIVFPFRVMPVERAAHYRSRCDELEAALGGKPRTVEVRQMHLHFPWARELSTEPAILDTVEKLLGPNFLIWATELFSKHPQDPNVMIGWHRDRGYMGLDPGDVATAWVALSDSRLENGCMKAIPGPSRFDGSDLSDETASEHRISDEQIDHSRLIDVELEAGEMSLHDPLIIHGSTANLSENKRVGFVIRFVKTTAQPAHGRPKVLRARGDAIPEHFEIVDPPAEDKVSLEQLRASATQHFDAMLINLQTSAS